MEENTKYKVTIIALEVLAILLDASLALSLVLSTVVVIPFLNNDDVNDMVYNFSDKANQYKVEIIAMIYGICVIVINNFLSAIKFDII